MNTERQLSTISVRSSEAFISSPADLWLGQRRKINRMHNIRGFIARWDKQPPQAQAWRYRLRRSPCGNINKSGQIGDLSAPALPYWHTQFEASLEEGVRALVLALIAGGRRISYTSCAGHDYRSRGRPNVERHVGLLPRDDREWDAIVASMHQIIAAGSGVGRAARPGLVASCLEDREGHWPVIDLYIARSETTSWDGYFAELERVSEAMARAVRAEAAATA